MPSEFKPEQLHGSAVALGAAGLLIVGSSGSGKSSLALELIALGATLVADDQVYCELKDDGIMMSAPSSLTHKIEARGLGILSTKAAPAFARLVVDMDVSESQRMPKERETVIMGVKLPLYRRVESPAFASMLWVLMQGGIA